MNIDFTFLEYLLLFAAAVSGIWGFIWLVVFIGSRVNPRVNSAHWLNVPVGVALLVLSLYLFSLVF